MRADASERSQSPFLMRALCGESATWALGSLGRKRTDGQRDSQGSLGRLRHAPATRPPMHPRNVGEEESEEAVEASSRNPGPSSHKILESCAPHTHRPQPVFSLSWGPRVSLRAVRPPTHRPPRAVLPGTVRTELCAMQTSPHHLPPPSSGAGPHAPHP